MYFSCRNNESNVPFAGKKTRKRLPSHSPKKWDSRAWHSVFHPPIDWGRKESVYFSLFSGMILSFPFLSFFGHAYFSADQFQCGQSFDDGETSKFGLTLWTVIGFRKGFSKFLWFYEWLYILIGNIPGMFLVFVLSWMMMMMMILGGIVQRCCGSSSFYLGRGWWL